MQLDFLDWSIIVLYLTITLGIGLFFRQRAGQSLSDYFISGRSLPWWIAGTSMVATTFAADTPLAVTGLVAKYGLAGNWLWWAFAFGGMLTVFVFARLWRRAEVMTDVELVELRYSGMPAAVLRGTRALYVALIINPIIIGWVTKAIVVVLKETVLHGETFAGLPAWLPADWLIIAGLLTIVGIYCTMSGMWGVAMTDFVQFFAAMIGCILLAVVAVKHVGGVDLLRAKVIEQFPAGEQAFRFLPDVTSENTWMPAHIFMIYLCVQWWATWYPGAEPGGGGYVVQRMASCKDEKHALYATLWYQVAHYCIRPWPWLMVAFVALVMFPGTEDAGFAVVIRELSPSGVRGLMIVTFFAAFMSTISTQMNWGASYLVRDIYQRFIKPDASDKQLTGVSRLVSLGVLLLGGIVSGVMVESGISIDEAWTILLALGAGTGAVFILRWFWWRINAWSEITAMLASLGYFIYFRSRFEHNEETMLAVACATIVTWIVVTFITPPDSREVLERFYRKVRPGGPGWGPLAKAAPDVEVDRNVAVSILMAVFSSAIVYLTIPGVGAIIFRDYLTGVGLLTGAAVCAAVVVVLMRRVGATEILK